MQLLISTRVVVLMTSIHHNKISSSDRNDQKFEVMTHSAESNGVKKQLRKPQQRQISVKKSIKKTSAKTNYIKQQILTTGENPENYFMLIIC